MSVLRLQNVSKSYGANDVFIGLSAAIAQGSRIGLVGPNGVGKTTLLQIIAGDEAPTNGEVNVASGVRIGYLKQEAMEAFVWQGNSLRGEMESVFTELNETSERMRELEALMADPDADLEAVLEEYGELQELFEARGGYDIDVRIRKTLAGLGFHEDQHDIPLEHLSGGQKTRALLARLLLEKPDLMILDEPTNHLDVEAIAWLEFTLRNWDGALVIVSHDRYFLDTTVNAIWELHPTHIEDYKGNYTAYLRQRQERFERHLKLYEKTKASLEKEIAYISKMIGTPRGKDNAEGRLKQLSRQLIAIDHVGLMEAMSGKKWSQLDIGNVRPLSVSEANKRIKRLKAPAGAPPPMRARFDTTQRGGDIVLTSTEMAVGYPGNTLFTSDPISLHRGEVAALIGPNGSGKTTFLRTVMREIEPLKGRARLGTNVVVGYFAQAHDQFDHEKRVIDELMLHTKMEEKDARSYLAKYQLTGDDAFKAIGDLSGGERARFALAIMALDGANFLLLDEPTNHLDIPSQEAIQSMLATFPGTILLVTHDRFLVDALATQIWELEDGHLHVFKGDYKAYLQRGEEEKARQRAEREAARSAREARLQAANGSVAERVTELELALEEAETKLEQLNAEIEEIGGVAAEDYLQELQAAYRTTQKQIADMLNEWEDLATPEAL